MKCRAIADCTEDASFGVVSEQEFNHGDTVVSVMAFTPVCAKHSNEHVREVRASTDPDNFTVVHILHAAGDPGRLS